MFFVIPIQIFGANKLNCNNFSFKPQATKMINTPIHALSKLKRAQAKNQAYAIKI